MRWLSNLTIRRRLTSISVLSSVTALLFASQAFLAYDGYTFRQTLARRIATEGQIIGFNSVSPLLFGDQEAATATLASLKAEPSVLAAAILSSGHATAFASYSRDGQAPPLVAPASAASGEPHFGDDGLLVSVPIQFEGQAIGRLLIRAELRELRERQWRYLGLGLMVLAGSFVLALAISRTVEKTISVPVLELAATARAVSERKDYSVRARAAGRDELGQLVGTFNQMLDQIERQNVDLEQARDELERRVDARTRELAASNQEMEAFAYSVSHDLRAPLRAIDGFSKALLQQAAGLDEQGRHYLQRVRAGTQRMADLIDDMLGLARISRKELVRQPLELSALAARVGAELGVRHAEQAVALQIAPGLQATADARLVTVLFENLLGNAWKFSSRKEHPRVEVGRQDGAPPVFYVRDNGAGFDMAYADKLFGAFQRLHSDTEFEGTGIGLATVQRIVHRHGGRVWAEAQPGQGATFYFTLEGEP